MTAKQIQKEPKKAMHTRRMKKGQRSQDQPDRGGQEQQKEDEYESESECQQTARACQTRQTRKQTRKPTRTGSGSQGGLGLDGHYWNTFESADDHANKIEEEMV